MNSFRLTISSTLFTGLLAWSLCAEAQIKEKTNKTIKLPDIPGYQTLKCDFHMHTVFSDGHVWPTFRVNEALRDGLDAISITEHIDYEGFPEVINKDYNKSYEIASLAAKNKNLIVIPGVEISPRVPPYHHNALFVNDANKLPIEYMENGKKQFLMKKDLTRAQLMAPFTEAKNQNSFVFYNHPGYSWWDKKDTTIFTDFHQELLEKKILAGVEVVNSGVYNILAHGLAIKYNLTMLSNTDEHYDNSPRYSDTHRPMTLVFAKERSAEGIREALISRRTALYFDDYLIARQKEAEAFFKSAVQLTSERKNRNGEHILEVKLLNNSDIPFRIKASAEYDIEQFPLGQTVLTPHATTTLVLKAMWKYPEETPLSIEVSNIIVSPKESFRTVFRVLTRDGAK
jgi:3',5'-nucleoside bisphosphate phosphatase